MGENQVTMTARDARHALLRLAIALLGLICVFPGFGVAASDEPPTQPILRVDPGEHTAPIWSTATDLQGRWLVTASDDKTLRVWSLTDGGRLATIRPPIGEGLEGTLAAVALSADGSLIAAGGWTQSHGGASTPASDGMSIYFFDRASGRMLKRISGLEDRILSLSFSPDGTLLVASLADDLGIRVFDLQRGRLLAEDRDYGGHSYCAVFASDGRILSTSEDGLLRLYRVDGSNLILLAKRAAAGGRVPIGARFSPDGKRIAVGFRDTPAVSVLDARTLAPEFSPDTSGLNGTLTSVAWSRDGRMLFGAGNAYLSGNGFRFIRAWPADGSGAGVNWPVDTETILALAPLPDGRLAFGTAGPAWGVVDSAGRKVIFHGPPVADFRDLHGDFRLSADGTQIAFGYGEENAPPAFFDVRQRAFLTRPIPSLTPPLLTLSGLSVSQWEYTPKPLLNGTPLELSDGEYSTSLALWPQADGFVLGTEFGLRAFTQSGSPRWNRSLPAVWDVNVSANGRWVVAACGDGTIRWFRAADGEEQLVFYPHPDRKRWVLWTPGGYYDASPGAEDLFGWHLNRGKDSVADFFPASRLRDRFYRPDVIERVLDGSSAGEAVAQANHDSGRKAQTESIAQSLPPVVRIISPAAETTAPSADVSLQFEAQTTADAPVTGVRVRVNGLAVKPSSAPSQTELASGGMHTLVVRIPERASDIQLFAENRNGISTAAAVHLIWSGPRQEDSSRDFSVKPKLYVLAIGISHYKNPDYALGLPAKDAKDFAEAFQRQSGRLYRDVEVKLLVDEQASRDGVLDGLDWLRSQVTAKDVGILFLAGHGENDPDGKYYFIPYDVDADKLRRTGVVFTEVRDTLSSLAGKALFFVDTCHSGNILGGRRELGTDLTGVINELSSAENGVVVFSSSTGRQYSLENVAWGNGAFTKAVVEGIDGKADLNKNGRITYKMLDFYVSERVKDLTHGQQTPVTQAPGGVPDFPIAIVH